LHVAWRPSDHPRVGREGSSSSRGLPSRTSRSANPKPSHATLMRTHQSGRDLRHRRRMPNYVSESIEGTKARHGRTTDTPQAWTNRHCRAVRPTWPHRRIVDAMTRSATGKDVRGRRARGSRDGRPSLVPRNTPRRGTSVCCQYVALPVRDDGTSFFHT